MKHVTTPSVREEADYYCDSCGKMCYLELVMTAWYGSECDLTKGTVHLCDDCWKKVKGLLKDNLKLDFKIEDIIL